MREIEVKMRVHDLAAIERKLGELGCVLSTPITQEDSIYGKIGDLGAWTKSKEGHVVMRIRRQQDSATFNLKEQKSSELDNIEIETKVQNPDAIHNILQRLGYEPHVTVKKTRRKGRFKDYEICLDTVEELGDFVELEKLADDNADPEQVLEELLLELESLGLSRNDREMRGYDTQIFQRTHQK
jgi:adenylate cyclase class 2